MYTKLNLVLVLINAKFIPFVILSTCSNGVPTNMQKIHFCALQSILIYLVKIFTCLLLLTGPAVSNENKVTLGVLTGRAIDRSVYTEMLSRHSAAQPGVIFDHVVADDKGYKSEIRNWLNSHRVDISYGQAGTQLCSLAAEQLISPLDEFWHSNKLDSRFSGSFRQAVSCSGQVYGIPLSYYYWGFFYKKSVFKKYNIDPPQTWEQLLEISSKLKEVGIKPFSIGTKNHWPSAAWFDYLNLRLNGLEFHISLLKGEQSFDDARVRNVMRYWKDLLDNNNFIENKEEIDWLQSMPYVYRELSGMILTGSFLANIIPQNMRDDFGFFRFPIIKPSIPIYEEVPTDVYILNSLSANKKAAIELLKFASSAQNQSWLAAKLGYLPPHDKARVSVDKFAQIGLKHIKQSAGFSQYFDRDALPHLAKHGPTVLAEFMQDRDIDKALFRLEKLRKTQLSLNSENKH